MFLPQWFPCNGYHQRSVRNTRAWSTIRSAPRLQQYAPQAMAAPTKRRSSPKNVPEPQRIAKVLAQANVASRRKAEELIAQGAVAVNGQVISNVATHVIPSDKITINGKPVFTPTQQQMYYFAVNKPKGYLCASAPDPSLPSNKLVIDLFKDWIKEWKATRPPGAAAPRLFTVGRLDVPTVGLVFVTNDGQWANTLAHPSSGLTKEYIATLDKMPATRDLNQLLREGCNVDGRVVVPTAMAVDDSDPHGKPKLRIVLNEGRNREVRRLMEHVGAEVTGLRRVRMGGYRLPRDLGVGDFRALKPHEVRRAANKGAQFDV